MRNIAIIAGQLAVGGAERQLYLWLSHLDRKRYRPVVVTLHPGCGDYWEGVIEGMGIQVVRVQRRRSRLARLVQIRRDLRACEPDLIHAWHLFASPYAGAVGWMSGKPSLGSLRGSYRSFRENMMQGRMAMMFTDGMIVNSAAAGKELASAFQGAAAKIHVVPNAVEDEVLSREEARCRMAERWGLNPGALWIGSMGRLEAMKRFDLLLEAMAVVRRKREKVVLLLVGDGREYEGLQRKAEEMGLRENVVFTGEDPEARHWLSALDIFCFPSMDEGLPNVVMEAGVAGLPVVAWQAPFVEELLENGRSAWLVERGNVNAMAEALAGLAGNGVMRREMGEAARKQILDRFGLPRYVERMSKSYEIVLAGGRI